MPIAPTALLWLGALYGGASVLCFGAYARDKWAARHGRRRTPERTLLLWGLAGGWPGGWLAQRWLHHKIAKPSFQRAYWCSVTLNLGALLALWQWFPA